MNEGEDNVLATSAGTLGGAAVGATAGLVGGPPGAVVGGIIGGVVGGIAGMILLHLIIRNRRITMSIQKIIQRQIIISIRTRLSRKMITGELSIPTVRIIRNHALLTAISTMIVTIVVLIGLVMKTVHYMTVRLTLNMPNLNYEPNGNR